MINKNFSRNKWQRPAPSVGVWISLTIVLLHSFFLRILEKVPNVDYILVLFSLLLLLFYYITKKSNVKVNISAGIIGWLLLMFIGIIHNYGMSQLEISGITTFIYISYMFLLIYDINWINTFIKTILLFTGIHALSTIIFFIDSNLYSKYLNLLNITANDFRSGLSGGNFGTNAIYLAIGVIGAFCFYLKKPNLKNFLFILFMIFPLLLTTKRAHTLFPLLVIIVIYYVYYPNKRGIHIFKLLLAIMAIIVGILICAYYIPQIGVVIDRFINSGDDMREITSGRTDLYEVAIKMFLEKPIWGHGWASYTSLMINYFSRWRLSGMAAHNVYLQLLAETGIVGFTVFIITVGKTFFQTYKLLLKSRKEFLSLFKEYEYYLCFSLGIQTFFILYCFTGNPLNDIQVFASYILSCGITYSLKYSLAHNRRNYKWLNVQKKLRF